MRSFFHAVEGFVILLNHLYYRTDLGKIVCIFLISGVCNFIIECDHIQDTVAEGFKTYYDRHYYGKIIFEFGFDRYAENDKIQSDANSREPDGFEILDVFIFLRLKYHNNDSEQAGRKKYRTSAYILNVRECLCCNHKQEETEHETITVIEPVRTLKTVPDKIKSAERKACKEEGYHTACRNLFAHGIFFRDEEQRSKNKRDNSAIYKWVTLWLYGVIGAGKQLSDKFKKVKTKLESPVSILESVFAELEGIVRSKNNNRRDTDGKNGICTYSQ